MFLKNPENNLVVIKYLYMLYIFNPSKNTLSIFKKWQFVKGTARNVDFHSTC